MPNGNPETIPYGYSFLSPGLTSLTRFSMACRYVSFAYLSLRFLVVVSLEPFWQFVPAPVNRNLTHFGTELRA